MNERELIEDCRKGNRQSFGAIYDTYVHGIYDFIYYKTHHKQTAEDLTQETFFKALKNIHQFDALRSFKSWLYRIAQNAVIDHYRKASRETPLDDAWDAPSETDMPADFDTRKQIDELRRQLSLLPSLSRDIILLRVWQDLSYKEISEIVGKSEDNCKMIYSRALRSLKGTMPILVLLMLVLKS